MQQRCDQPDRCVKSETLLLIVHTFSQTYFAFFKFYISQPTEVMKSPFHLSEGLPVALPFYNLKYLHRTFFKLKRVSFYQNSFPNCSIRFKYKARFTYKINVISFSAVIGIQRMRLVYILLLGSRNMRCDLFS